MNVFEKHPNTTDTLRQSSIITSNSSDFDVLKAMLDGVEDNMNKKLEEMRKIIEELRSSQSSNKIESIIDKWEHIYIASPNSLSSHTMRYVDVYYKKVEHDTQLLTFSQGIFPVYVVSEFNFNTVKSIYDDVITNYYNLLIKTSSKPTEYNFTYSLFCDPNNIFISSNSIGNYLFLGNEPITSRNAIVDIHEITNVINSGTKIELKTTNPSYIVKKGSCVLLARFSDYEPKGSSIFSPNVFTLG